VECVSGVLCGGGLVWYSAMVSINAVALRWVRTGMGDRSRVWVVFNQLPRLTQPSHPFWVNKMIEYQRKLQERK